MIGRVHTVTDTAVAVGVSAADDAVVSALEEAFGRGLPLALLGLWTMTAGDLQRVSSLAEGLFPAWRWLWRIPSPCRAELFHVAQREGL